MASFDTFKPGLLHLSSYLNEGWTYEYLAAVVRGLDDFLSGSVNYVKPALLNMKALCLFNMGSRRIESRLLLEELHNEYPDDLNILADLIYINEKLGTGKKATKYEEELKAIEDDPLLQARSILAQAFVLSYYAERGKSPNSLLKDTLTQLEKEDINLEQVNRASNLIMEAHKEIETIHETPSIYPVHKCEMADDKFKHGIKMLETLNCSEEEMLVWKFHFAENRHCLFTTYLSATGCPNCRVSSNPTKFCSEILKIYLDVITNFPPEGQLKRLVSMSYIRFALLSLDCIERMDPSNIPEIIKNQDLDSMCSKALSLLPDDTDVVDLCMVYQIEKGNHFEAIKISDEFIRQVPDERFNLINYLKRGSSYLKCIQKLSKEEPHNKAKIFEYSELAYNDFKLCFSFVSTQNPISLFLITNFAIACFWRSMPDIPFHLGSCCRNKQFLYESLDILNEALEKYNETKEYEIYPILRKCYLYIGEYRRAIESIKTSLELHDWSEKRSNDFCNLSNCFMAFYYREKDTKILSEFRFMLKEAKKRDRSEWITEAIALMCQEYSEMLIDLVKNMIEWDVRGCQHIIKEVFNKSDQNRSGTNRIYQNLMEEFKKKLEKREVQESENNRPQELPPLQRTEHFQYDFYVSHSENDKDWVISMLRPRLEDLDEEINFTGYIPCRDSKLGDNVFESIDKGIERSRNILIILTPDYLEDNWQKMVSHMTIFSVIKKKVKTIIPIILKKCKVPPELQTFKPIHFTEKSQWDLLCQSLTKKMDSEIGQEERKQKGQQNLMASFKPGLLHLDSIVDKGLSNKYLSDKIEELQISYSKPVVKNLQAVLLFNMDFRRTEGRLMLEELHKEFPDDINILADLVYCYKKIGIQSMYKKKLESLKDNTLLQAKSMLAQGLALYVMGAHTKDKTILSLLKDTHKELDQRDKNSEKVNRASNLVADAYKVIKTIPETPYVKRLGKLQTADKKFKDGIEILENLNCFKEEILVWKFYFASNRKNRIECEDDYFSNNLFSSDPNFCLEVFEAFLDVIINLPSVEEMQIFVARSYIEFALLSLKWIESTDQASLPEIIKSQDLDSMCHQAMSIGQNYPTVIGLCGWYQCRKKNFLEAIEIYDQDISQSPEVDSNWNSYANRGGLCFQYSRELMEKYDIDQSDLYLERAYSDIKVCLTSPCRETSYITHVRLKMARICFFRGMSIKPIGFQLCCKDENFIKEALQILKIALDECSSDQRHMIQYNLGLNYSCIGECRKAIDRLKICLELENWPEKIHYSILEEISRNFMSLYEEEDDIVLLNEFSLILNSAKKMGYDKLVTDSIDFVCKHYPKTLIDLIESMVGYDVQDFESLISEMFKTYDQNPPESIRVHQNLKKWETFEIDMILRYESGLPTDCIRNLAEMYVRGWSVFIGEALNKYYEHNIQESIRIYQNLQESFETKLKEIKGNNQESEINERLDLKYDCFISHSDNEKDWIESELRPWLKRNKSKVHTPRDFMLGDMTIDAWINGIKRSRNILIVLTPDYLKDDWLKYVKDTIVSIIDKQLKRPTIIPIILKECDVPTELKDFHPIFFTEKYDWELLYKRLSIGMDSETIEETNYHSNNS